MKSMLTRPGPKQLVALGLEKAAFTAVQILKLSYAASLFLLDEKKRWLRVA